MNRDIFLSLFSLAGQSILLDTITIFFAVWWEYFVVISFLAYLVFPGQILKDKKEKARIVALAIFSAVLARFVFVTLIRFFWLQERPFVSEQLIPLVRHAASASFPSGHATFFMALSIFIILSGRKKFGWFLFFSAIAISIGRVMVGIHWPQDILAGWLLGGAVSFFVW